MTEKKQVYKCDICGIIVEILHEGVGEIVCCNKPMRLITENTEDAAQEKHVPVIEKTETGIKVNVGSIEHPMDSDHYIEWIEVIADGKVYRQYLSPGDTPMAEFNITSNNIEVRAYCNLHGLWKS
ncbi:desulfoferrodoxin [Candidatus Woesearchaeota archaeon]|nr:desulfoferrodoxin [Candidatus Woesearchaeota archaeon]